MLLELPLVIFTLAANMSAGSFIVLGLIHLFSFGVKQEVVDKVTLPALYAIGPLLVFGFLASSFHLGNPLNAINSIRHFPVSPLSREIVFGMAFLGLGALFAFMQWFKWGTHRLRQAVAFLAAIAGVVLVYTISQVYSLSTVPAWATYHTPIRFFMTSVLLGGLAVGAALVIAAHIRTHRRGQDDRPEARALINQSIRAIAFGAILILGMEFVAYPAYMAYLGTHDSAAAAQSLHLLTDTYGTFSAAQTMLTFAGIALLGFLLYRMSADPKVGARLIPVIAVVAFVLVLSGEVVSRMLFYASMVRVGL